MAGAPVPKTIAPDTAAGRRRRRAQASARAKQAGGHGVPASARSQSLLDVVDNLIDKGLALDTEVVLGLADIDLIYLRAGALLAAADRVFPRTPATRHRTRATTASGSPSSATPLASHATRTVASLPARSNAKSGATGPMATASDDASRSVIRLVLTLVEFVRQLLERQAVRRVRKRTLTPEEIERLGTALMRLESTVHELAERHGLDPADLNLDLGPLGTLR
jgi:Gas vesicle protein K/Gas vesicle protein